MYNKNEVDEEAEREGIALKKQREVQGHTPHKRTKQMVCGTGFDKTPQGREALWNYLLSQITKEKKRDPLSDFPG